MQPALDMPEDGLVMLLLLLLLLLMLLLVAVVVRGKRHSWSSYIGGGLCSAQILLYPPDLSCS